MKLLKKITAMIVGYVIKSDYCCSPMGYYKSKK